MKVLRSSAFALVAFAAVVVAPNAGGRAGNTVQLAVGDYFRASDANGFNGIICYRAPDAVPVKSIECYVASANGTRPSSYSGFITACTTSVWRYDAQGGNPQRVFARSNRACRTGEKPLPPRLLSDMAVRPASRARSRTAYDLTVGDSAIVIGTAIHCFLAPDAVPRGSVECYLHARTKSGVKLGTYSVFITPSALAIYHYVRGRAQPIRVYGHSEPAP